MASYYLRVVQPWGVEDFEEITIPPLEIRRLAVRPKAAPASFANSLLLPFVTGIKAAREKIVAARTTIAAYLQTKTH
jgi:hypothetical protein